MGDSNSKQEYIYQLKKVYVMKKYERILGTRMVFAVISINLVFGTVSVFVFLNKKDHFQNLSILAHILEPKNVYLPPNLLEKVVFVTRIWNASFLEYCHQDKPQTFENQSSLDFKQQREFYNNKKINMLHKI